MTDTGPFKALSLLTSVGILVVAACTIQLRGGEGTSAPPKAEQTLDLDGSDLARCRTVTSEDVAGYQHCQKVWAENRRRFFGRKDGAAASRGPDPVAGLTPAPKDESRMPQGYPSVALPEASKP
ncbi:putative entry exclusion protein TrbK-alt [Bradyrhizobium sp. GCM10027634]|uniref:putative entry exclusion protein TrbK-alt n=1 Tax=unclassified Bradyrhizobium TaxID=2631580 RepID=UPI00263BAE8A|nr:putative entry exclusion protein TrbK-alt [Bradyrhizobium sp. WYCCWR 12677]MDN5005513.1 putative entry exclusion protein TrbK-alt [Bradyrhizobium sp. WYCCWR 12677]